MTERPSKLMNRDLKLVDLKNVDKRILLLEPTMFSFYIYIMEYLPATSLEVKGSYRVNFSFRPFITHIQFCIHILSYCPLLVREFHFTSIMGPGSGPCCVQHFEGQRNLLPEYTQGSKF